MVEEAAVGDLDVEEVARPRRVRGCVGRPGRSCRRRRAARHGPGPPTRTVWLRCGRRARRCAPCRGACVRALATTTARRPSARVTSQAAQLAAGTGTHVASGRGGGVEGFGAGRVAVQPGGQDVVEPVAGDDVDVVDGDQAAVGDDADPPHPEAGLQVLEHRGQGGDVGGVAGEHVMGDRDAVAGAQQADHHLRPIGAMVPGVAERPGREPVRRARVSLRSRSTSSRSRPGADPSW